jgi:hypothetical protein
MKIPNFKHLEYEKNTRMGYYVYEWMVLSRSTGRPRVGRVAPMSMIDFYGFVFDEHGNILPPIHLDARCRAQDPVLTG